MEVVQLKDASQKEGAGQQNPGEQFHGAELFQTQIIQSVKSIEKREDLNQITLGKKGVAGLQT